MYDKSTYVHCCVLEPTAPCVIDSVCLPCVKALPCTSSVLLLSLGCIGNHEAPAVSRSTHVTLGLVWYIDINV